MQIDGYSLDAQKTKMKAFCDYNEYEIAAEYEDAGKSGKSIEGKQTFSGMTETYSQSVECGKLLSYFEKWNTEVSSRDLFREAVQKFCDDNRLTAQELKKDWREMTDEEWEKMLEGVDEIYRRI